ncbi:MAG: SEC-C metal-binding domain-containing protein [Paludibacteraceae bacterium]
MKEKRKVLLCSPEAGYNLKAQKVGRNQLCPCGSGKKAKKLLLICQRYYSESNSQQMPKSVRFNAKDPNRSEVMDKKSNGQNRKVCVFLLYVPFPVASSCQGICWSFYHLIDDSLHTQTL